MSTLLIYMLKVAASCAIFFLVYRIFFSNDTLFTRNRIYLFLSIAIMFIAPLLTIPLITRDILINTVPKALQGTANIENTLLYNSNYQIINIVFYCVYFIGVLVMLFRSIVSFRKVFNIIHESNTQVIENRSLAVSSKIDSPFSFWHRIVIPEKYTTHQEIEKIVRHEMIHCRQYHSVDLFLAEMLVIVQWFNPFAWLLKTSIIQNNEYSVDKQLLEEGVERQTYQYLLLQTTICKPNLAMGNYFSAHLLKKRIHMMNKSDSPKWYGVKNMMILVAVLMVLALGAYLERNMRTNVIASTNTAPTPVTEKEEPIYIRDGKIISLIEMRNLDKSTFQSISYISAEEATKLYGGKYKNDVVIIKMKPLSPLLPK